MVRLVVELLLVASFLLASADALKCYRCSYNDKQPESSVNNKTCADPFDESKIQPVNCDATEDVCRKYITVKESNEETIISRGCEDSLTQKKECATFNFDGYKSTQCQCQGDNCNHGNRLMTYTFNGLMTFAVVCGVMLQRSFCAVA
jgi:hypothetical protein